MKKILLFGAIFVVIFGALAIVTNMQKKEAVKGNPYGKTTLHPSTEAILDDPNYQNNILPDELEKKVKSGEDFIVYFYASDCSYCKRTTPVLMPLAEEMGIEIDQFNLKEFPDYWETYGITGTPTLVHFKDGKEVAASEGEKTKEQLEPLLKEWSGK
ncbi:thioredoxin fold domain-containing protein [Bacillus mangrovi]|uniref:Thioredoxin fold domain-containing protein n=1 Tax=Metabacillus mangrovi TaxID=1491830 RepID=A0A7X2S572_9BACI|nr:thioredoxin family protein [Metabacillus mangrovi]MTH53453.1 thioredoxin fold domain-containing protein [Metabacillus mangrovi]